MILKKVQFLSLYIGHHMLFSIASAFMEVKTNCQWNALVKSLLTKKKKNGGWIIRAREDLGIGVHWYDDDDVWFL